MPQAPSRQRPEGAPVAAATSRGASLVQLGAAGYDWLFDHVDPLGGADHRRRLVATSRSCRRWSAPTSSAWRSGPPIPSSRREAQAPSAS
jgi:hypothetical protein